MRKKHNFEVVRTSKFCGDLVICPVCGIRRWDTAMRNHIANSSDRKHRDYYQENTFEQTKITKVWKI